MYDHMEQLIPNNYYFKLFCYTPQILGFVSEDFIWKEISTEIHAE